MHETLYDTPSLVIAVILFAAMTATVEVSYRVGFRRRRAPDDAYTAHVNAVQAALLGILALVLGFTFSLSLQRHDSRSESVVEEANAIGTAWLRSQLLTTTVRAEVQEVFKTYVDARLAEGELTAVDHDQKATYNVIAQHAQARLWALAVQAVRDDPDEVRTGMFVEALNEAIDAMDRRDASFRRHVPEVALLLLFGTFLMASASIGYAAGIAAYRPSVVTHVMILLIVMLVFLIIDVDRPRRGLVMVNMQSMRDVQARVHGVPLPPIPAPAPRR